MSFKITYEPLIDIKINHDYFLDDGANKFEDMNDADKKAQLIDYNISDFLSIVPTPQTKLHLKNHKIVFKQGDQGFTLLADVEEYEKAGGSSKALCPKIQLEKELTFTFALKFKDPFFNNYTDSDLSTANRFYYFSNVRPDDENSSFPNFLKKDDVHIDFLLKPESSRKVLYDILTKEVTPIDSFGLETISLINPEDINSSENEAILNTYIETEKGNGLVGYVRFTINGDGNNDILEDTTVQIPESANQVLGCLPNKVPDAVINFRNRKTFWKYIKVEEDKEFKIKKEQPLTQNGYIQLKKKDIPEGIRKIFLPNPDKDGIRIEDDKIYSEIFI